MTKRQFLDELRTRLSPLPQLDIEKTIAFYSEMTDDRMDDGLTEEEAVGKLESPAVIAERIISESGYAPAAAPTVQKPKSDYRALWITLAIIGSPIWLSLLLVLFSAVLAVIIALFSVIIALFSVFAALAASAAGIAIAGAALLTVYPLGGVFLIGAALICAGLSILIFIISAAAAKAIVRFITFLCRKLRSAFSRKKGV